MEGYEYGGGFDVGWGGMGGYSDISVDAGFGDANAGVSEGVDTSMISVNAPPGVSLPGYETGYGGDSAGQATDWQAVMKSAALGLSLFGPAGAVVAGLVGWGAQQPGGLAGPGQPGPAASVSADMDGGEGAAKQSPEQSAVAAPADAEKNAGQATNGDGVDVTGSGAKAEDAARKRPGYGYLEAIAGEVAPEQAMLWTPNFQNFNPNFRFLG